MGLSLVLLTAYFGESAGGGLHSLQRGVLSVLAPIQEGTSRALKPFRDLFGWFDDTWDARGERDKIRSERDRLRKEVIGADAARRENAELRRLVGIDSADALDGFGKVTARVIGRSPTVWYATITIDKGSSSGVATDQPVINGDGLVGKVTATTPGASQVTLITDHTSGVSSKVVTPTVTDSANGFTGIVQSAVGNPGDLLLDFVPRRARVQKGDRVVTAGSRSTRLESLFPPGIPIGTISKVDEEELSLYQRVHVKPYADLRRLDFVQVLVPGGEGPTASTTGTDRAQTP